jgi:ABC-type Zn uptake system ZnuABC Zn-binding protein ZnuA
MRRELIAALTFGLAALWIVGCGTAGRAQRSVIAEPYLTPLENLRPIERPAGEPLRVLATTSILGDVVGQVGGEAISLTTLIPAGVDPHAFQPTPRDARLLADADVIFINGFGLEEFMADLIEQAGGDALVVSASLGITPLEAPGEHAGKQTEHEGEGPPAGADPQEPAVDPHTWFDPNNVIHWTENIQAALAASDPDHAQEYAANAAAYRAQLQALDSEIRASVERIPPERRRLVTDHEELGYFAEEYGFEVAGTVLTSSSSLAEPSAQEMAALFDQIRAQGIPAIFVTSVANPALAQRLAEDAGVQLVTLQGHSLTNDQGAASSYLDLMRYNVRAIVEALAP